MNVSQFLLIALVSMGAFFIVDTQITGYFGGYYPLSTTVTDCMDLTTENEVYILTGNVYGNQSHGACFKILANNVTLDCDGYNITGSVDGSSLKGISLDGFNNATIKNCIIKDYYTGAFLFETNYTNIINTTIIDSNDFGLDVGESHYVIVDDLTVNNVSLQVRFYNGSFNTIKNSNLLVNGADYGILLMFDCLNHTIENNTISQNIFSSMWYGIGVFDNSNGVIIFNNTVNSINGSALSLDSSHYGNISYNTFSSNREGIDLTNSTDNIIVHNILDSNDYYGVYIDIDSTGNEINYTRACDNYLGDVKDLDSNIFSETTCDTSDPTGLCVHACPVPGVCECDSCASCTDALNDTLCAEVRLNQSIIDHAGTCIDNAINFTNKTFDCNKNSITGDLSGIAINLFDNNLTTIQNCTISNFSHGVIMNNSWWGMLNNNNIENNLNGILVINSSWGATIIFNNFTNNINTDIIVKDESPLFVSGFNTFNLSNVGVLVYNTTQTRILNSVFYNTSTFAINSTESEGTFVFDTDIYDCLNDCVIFENGKDNYVENVTILNAVGNAFIFKNQEEIELRNLSIKNALGAGIIIDNTTLLEDLYNLEDLFYLESNTYGLRIFNCLGTIKIANCNITNNTVGIWANTSALNVHYNNLWNNANFSVQNVNASMNVNAASNWWNTTTTPNTGATPPKNASLNVTVGDWLKAPARIETPVYVASPLNSSYTNGTIYLNVFTNRNATCRYGTSPGSLTDMASTGGTNHTQTATASSEGERTYYFSCTNDIGLIRTNNTTIFVDLTPPVISSIKLDSVTGTTIYISWTTNDDTTTKTYYRAATPPTTSPLDILNNTIPSTIHSANINHPLNSGTTYYVQVYAYDHVYNPTNTTIYRFVTENKTVPLFEILEINDNTTTVTFTNPKLVFFIQANEPKTGCEITASESTLKPFATAPNIAFTYLNITANPALESVLNWTYINYTYTESEMNARGINASTLRMYRYNETATAWQLIADSDVNITGKYVWANVSEFSYFAVVGKLNNGAVCTSDNQCLSDNCAADYDGSGKWCAPSTNCAHDGNISILTNTYRCDPDNVNDSLKCSNSEWIRTTCSLGCDTSTGLCIVTSPITGGGGGGPGPSTTTPSTSITFIWDVILPNAPAVAILTSDNISISKVTVNVNETVSGDISLKVAQYSAKPAAVTELEDVYAYLEATPQNIPSSKISSVKIEFSVDTAWLTANGIPSENVVLQRYTTTWNPLQTNYLGTSGNKSLYSVTITGFSYFAITGSATDVPIIAPPETDDAEQPPVFEYCGDGICQSNEDCLTCPVDCGVCITQQETESSNTMFYVIIIIAGVAAASIFAIVYLKFLRKGEPIEKPTSTQSYAPTYQYPKPIQGLQPYTPPEKEHQLEDYVNKMLQKGVPEENIRTALKKVGWNARTINKVMVLGKLPPEYLERAENYANVMLQRGVSKEIIKQRLMAKRWPEDIVNQILNK